MNIKHIIRVVGGVFAAGSAVKTFAKSRKQGDKLRMVDAGLGIASAALTIAITVRDIRAADDHSRVVDLEDEA